MAIFYTDTGSLSVLQVSGSATISGSGSGIFTISGSSGGVFEVSDLSAGSSVFQISSASIDIFTISQNKNVSISGSLTITGSLNTTTGLTSSLQGTASWATNAISSSYALSASWAPGGSVTSTFPYTGSAIISGSLTVTGSTISTLGFTGSLQGTSSWAQNTLTASYVNTLNQDVNIVSGALTVDVDSITDSLSVAGFIGNQNDYLEIYIQNLSSGVSASSDIVAYANNGNETSSYIDMGINSSGIGAGYSFGNGNDGYVYNTGGNLYIGNNTAFYQPGVTQQSLFLFANASGSPDLTITGSRVGIRKSGSLNATLDINGNTIITGSLNVTQGITGSLLGTASFASTASFALNAGGGSGFPFAGIAIITGSIVLTSGSGFPTLLASETLTAGDLVNIFSGGVRKASSTDTTKQAHGFVTASYSSTNPVIVFYSGLNTQVSGLTAGTRYFLSASGAESATPPTAINQLYQEIGVAISTTALLFQPGPAIIT